MYFYLNQIFNFFIAQKEKQLASYIFHLLDTFFGEYLFY